MKTVLVPTDFSDNSKAGLKFALKWAETEDVKLEFVNVHHPVPQREIPNHDIHKNSSAEVQKAKKMLENFITETFSETGITPKNYSTAVIEGFSADVAIMDYCSKNPDINFICISTRGAGGLKKMVGTNTGNLITHSIIPVIAVPQNYAVAKISNVLYASDLEDYDSEITKVMEFAEPLEATIEVLHFIWPNADPSKNQELQRDYPYGFELSFPPHNVTQKLINNLQDVVKAKGPSVVIMFTNQEKTFWQKLISPSKTEQISFEIEVPMLVFRKEVS